MSNIKTYLAVGAVGRARGSLNEIGKRTGFTAEGGTNPDLAGMIIGFINIALGLVGIVASVYILYYGFIWMKAGGNDQEIKAAKDGIKNSIIGLAIILLSYIIVNYVITAVLNAIN